MGYQRKLKIHCCREIQDSLEDSNIQTIGSMIERMGLTWFYRILKKEIRGANGTVFKFLGLEEKRESIKGWEQVDVTWVEQAERMSAKTADVLLPTIYRHPGAELWLTWNPVNRTDWAWYRTVSHPEPSDVSEWINHWDNPFFDEGNRRLMEKCKREEPHKYPHLWEGFPDDSGGGEKFLPYALLEDCVRAYTQGLAPEDNQLVDAGLDIADAGADLNALVVRRGPLVYHVEAWPSNTPGFLSPTAIRAHERAVADGVYTLYFDGTGLGAPMRGELIRQGPSYGVKAIQFGGAVAGETKHYTPGKPNKVIFSKRNAQLGEALRLRAMRTARLLAGEDVDPDTCLFISDKIPRLEHYLAQLSQPTRRLNPLNAKIEVDKRGEENEKSPDTFDATAMAFARDSEQGLRAD